MGTALGGGSRLNLLGSALQFLDLGVGFQCAEHIFFLIQGNLPNDIIPNPRRTSETLCFPSVSGQFGTVLGCSSRLNLLGSSLGLFDLGVGFQCAEHVFFLIQGNLSSYIIPNPSGTLETLCFHRYFGLLGTALGGGSRLIFFVRHSNFLIWESEFSARSIFPS